ncbi:hypothetical protein MFIFM68171_02386 [Madurella fahalii]|uniref:tRNA(Phe) 7-[(3-amino-3-carboxypropyl)-4-demethylwyosine(37)-N(4)]-methyltransferase n=1 Tax=Madurella fahalii TaxID=1157608 RepID=A0ABQ0G364_9PEZI
MKPLPQPGPTFSLRKQRILSQLSVPDAEYIDASPKGSVDEGIRELIGRINAREGLVTTSSCAGRVSVYLEGRRRGSNGMGEGEAEGDVDADGEGGGDRDGSRQGVVAAGSAVGGKGGGEWLFISHDPVTVPVEGDGGYGAILGFEAGVLASVGEGSEQGVGPSSRLIHFKFEPMILHVLTASLEHAQMVIQAGMEAGFRETGAVSLLKRQSDEEAMPMVAVRSMGLSFESLIGVETDGIRRSIVASEYLKTLVQIANERFVENQKRIARFSAALEAAFVASKGMENWEDTEARRERKRQEGLRRRDELKKVKRRSVDASSVDLILQQPDVL